MTTTSSAVKTAAVRYVTRGWTILPLFGVDQDGDCGCGNPDCQSPGKHPAGMAWKTINDATDAAAHYDENPHHNIGIVAGPSRLVIIDLDGPDAIAAFMSRVSPEAVKGALAVDTARGVHLYFDDATGEYGPMVGRDDDAGIDVRAGSSYVVAPPSTHKSGHVYRWRGDAGQYAENAEPLPLPAEVRTYLDQRKAGSRVRVLGDAQRIGEGQRHTTMVSLAGTMRARGMSEREIRAALDVANEERCDPPMDARDVARIAQSVSRYEPNQTRDPLALLAVLVGNQRDADAAATAPNGYAWLDEAEVAALPPTTYLVEELIPERALTMTYGRRSSGKSFDALDLGLCVATGRPYHGFATVRGPVAYVMAEGQGGAAKRIDAWKRAHGVAGPIDGFRMLMRSVRLASEESVGELVTSLAAWPDPPQLLIIDTLARCMSGLDENKASDSALLVHHLGEITRLVGCGVHLVHHAGWNDDHERGSSLLGDACDAVTAMRRLDHDDPKSAIRWKPEKTKEGEIPPPQTLRIVPVAESGSAVLETAQHAAAAVSDARDAVRVQLVVALLRRGDGAASMADVCSTLGESGAPLDASTVRAWRKKPVVAQLLADAGVSWDVSGGRGGWRLVEPDRDDQEVIWWDR